MTDEVDPMQALQKSNAEGLAELDAGGLDTNVLMSGLRLAVLLELMLPSGSPLRNTYEAIFASNLDEHIKAGRSELARHKLTDGVHAAKPEGLAM